MTPFDIALLAGLIFVAAVIYSSVGHAGASGYVAAMALFGLAPMVMKPTALTLNIIVATLVHGGVTSISPDGATIVHTPMPDRLTTNACFAGADLRTLYVTLSTTGKLAAIDNWPTKGLKLNFQA